MKKTLLATSLLAFSSFSLAAKEKVNKDPLPSLKIGYADVDYIIVSLPETKKIESEYASFEKQIKGHLESKLGEFQQKLQEFHQGQEKQNEEVKDQKLQELQQMQKDLEQLQQESQEKLVKKRNSLLSPIDEKVRNAIMRVAEEHRYTYVFSTSTGSGVPVLLYSGEEGHNVSDLVLEKLGVSPSESSSHKDTSEHDKSGKAKTKRK